MKVLHDQYIFPPRPSRAVPRSDCGFYGECGWIAQLKFNDSRCLVKFVDGGVELWNRHGERFRSYHAPDFLVGELLELRDRLGLSASEVSILDGGLLDQKHLAIKDSVVIWDILVRDGVHLVGSSYKERYESIALGCDKFFFFEGKAFGFAYSSNVFYPCNYEFECWDAMWEEIAEVNRGWLGRGFGPVLEGLVFKDLGGVLEFGFSEKNNSHWVARSRIETGRHLF